MSIHPMNLAALDLNLLVALEAFLEESSVGRDLLLPPLLKRLEEEAPSVCIRVQLLPDKTADLFELARRVDVAVACEPARFKGFYQQRLFTDRDACALRRGHPIKRRIAKPEEFLTAKHVSVVGREFTEDPVDAWLRQEGVERNVVLSVPHYLQALHVVSESGLIAVVPERLIRAYAEILDLEAVPVPLDAGTFDEYLLHPARSHADPGCMWLRGVLVEVAKSLGPLEPKRVHKMPKRRPSNKVVPRRKKRLQRPRGEESHVRSARRHLL